MTYHQSYGNYVNPATIADSAEVAEAPPLLGARGQKFNRYSSRSSQKRSTFWGSIVIYAPRVQGTKNAETER
jgi:hypothetical protein